MLCRVRSWKAFLVMAAILKVKQTWRKYGFRTKIRSRIFPLKLDIRHILKQQIEKKNWKEILIVKFEGYCYAGKEKVTFSNFCAFVSLRRNV